MISTRTRLLLLSATLLGGLLAGSNLDRAVVAMPAWSQMETFSWAAFSRRADLGNGLVLYPIEALLGAALALSAAISYGYERAANHSVSRVLWSAVIFVVGGLLITLKAAPIMLNLSHTVDLATLHQDFGQFYFWGDIRGMFEVLAFIAELWALSAL